MPADLLAPSPKLGLLGQTTIVNFMEVQFPEMPGTILWLKRKVTVAIEWAGKVPVKTTFGLPGKKGTIVATNHEWVHQTCRKVHRYSDYKLSATKSRIKY